ncbi:MAG: DUF1254 domain-containing protein [Bacteroidetes bacterium]|nr:DUF1254 domain-containing protein [Bacteroidota bacterium]MBP7399330.1 DUF1254 domain-containing protein [Chitinophagales bacterium]MBP9019619.1 DUF1254 domain-containing protein [Bacteroidales bacterium]MBK7109542.1 DUF1254 domain-containing protein [Bacteroidota bacterium]MBK8682536.1 DUF1254 domain-containing protein [Bacteroidota bacterium]
MKKSSKFIPLICISALALMTSCNQNDKKAEDSKSELALTTEEVKDIAADGFVYGLPLAMNYAVMNEYAVDSTSSQYKAPFNQIKNEPRVYTYKDVAILSANSDTPYSVAWLDLRAEPVVITVPEVEKGRYYSVQLVDGNLYNRGYIGSRTTGNGAGTYVVVGPDWKGEMPTGFGQVFHSTTPFMLVIFRTQLFNPKDMPNVIKIQSGYNIQTLSAFQKQPAPAAAPKINFLPATAAEVKNNFWNYLNAALNYIPESDMDKDIRARLAKLGIGAGMTFDMTKLSTEQQQAMAEGMKAGDAKVTEFVAAGATDVNGWQVGSLWGDSDFYNGDWLKRAGGGRAGIYGNNAEEAMYLLGRKDAKGEILDGSKHNYTLTFPAGSLPPVNAFWSVTMYYGDNQLLVKNPIDRYLINTPMLSEMKKNKDGSMTLYIQKDSPGKDKESNWLPAPDGPIYLALRLYWPTPASEASSVLPPGKGSWGPPGVEVAD